MKTIFITKKDFNKTFSQLLRKKQSSLLSVVYESEDSIDDLKFVIQQCNGLLKYSLRAFENNNELFAMRNFNVKHSTTIKQAINYLIS
jgi:hypothetical protein